MEQDDHIYQNKFAYLLILLHESCPNCLKKYLLALDQQVLNQNIFTLTFSIVSFKTFFSELQLSVEMRIQPVRLRKLHFVLVSNTLSIEYHEKNLVEPSTLNCLHSTRNLRPF